MRARLIIAVAVLATFAGTGCGDARGAATTPEPRGTLTYVMVHLEAGYEARLGPTVDLPPGVVLPDAYMRAPLGWQEYFWPTLVDLVEQANALGVALTLAANPQWGEYIAADPARLEQVHAWQSQGHELAFHHHQWTHSDWNGYANITDIRDPTDKAIASDPLYLGDSNAGFSLVRDLAAPVVVISSTMGGLPKDMPSSMVAPAGRDLIFGFGTWLDSYPGPGELRSLRPARREKDIAWLELPLRTLTTVMGNGLSVTEGAAILREQYLAVADDEVFGIVFHEFDFHLQRNAYLDWFRFIETQGDSVRAMGHVASLWSERWETTNARIEPARR